MIDFGDVGIRNTELFQPVDSFVNTSAIKKALGNGWTMCRNKNQLPNPDRARCGAAIEAYPSTTEQTKAGTEADTEEVE